MIETEEHHKARLEAKEEQQDVLSDIAYEESACPHCSLPMHEHDGSDFCPGGTEEFGGRR